eukprot:34440-Prymnesium_polylepis.1
MAKPVIVATVRVQLADQTSGPSKTQEVHDLRPVLGKLRADAGPHAALVDALHRGIVWQLGFHPLALFHHRDI